MSSLSLWGEEFTVEDTPKKVKKIVSKANAAKPAITQKRTRKSKPETAEEIQVRLNSIYSEVRRVLGRYADNTVVIKSREQLHDYIDAALANNAVAIDTETNNSLDPVTCKLMGPCLYTPGQKNAYIPINHIDLHTRERLPWQLTESDIKEEFSRLSNIFVVYHNGKFDYEVIKCTSGLELPISWDTLIGAKLLDENELKYGLKEQYINKVDPSVEKYSIEKLFDDIEYAVVDPEIFALYSATDPFMTYKLYEYQKKQFENPSLSKLYNMFQNIEMPLVKVIAEMELAGMNVDQEYGERLSAKYHRILDNIDSKIQSELDKLQPKIQGWRLTPEANYHPPKKTGNGEGKSKSEQLTDPVNLASPTQLAILIYDILKAPQVSRKSPRGTGEDELIAISEKMKLPLFDLILQRRAQVKLLTTYIDVIPELSKRWPDGRVRTHFNQYGAATGRLSSSDPINF